MSSLRPASHPAPPSPHSDLMGQTESRALSQQLAALLYFYFLEEFCSQCSPRGAHTPSGLFRWGGECGGALWKGGKGGGGFSLCCLLPSSSNTLPLDGRYPEPPSLWGAQPLFQQNGAGAPWPEAVTSAVAVGSPLPSAAPSLSASLPCALRPRAFYPARGPGPSSRVSPAWLCPTVAAAAHLTSLPSTSAHDIQTVCASSPSTFCVGYSPTCLLPPPAVLWGAASPRAVAWRELSQVTCTLSHFSHVQLLVSPWTVAHQAPLSMRFSRQGYWSGLPCPSYKLPQNRGTQTRWFLRFLPNLRFKFLWPKVVPLTPPSHGCIISRFEVQTHLVEVWRMCKGLWCTADSGDTMMEIPTSRKCIC